MTTQGIRLENDANPAFDGAEATPSGANSPSGYVLGPQVTRTEFAAACQTHLSRVFRQLRAMGVADRYLDDATQEVFLIAHQKLADFEARAQLGTWLYAIAYRVGCNYRRRAYRDPKSPLVEDNHASHGRDPEQSLVEKQAAHFVQAFCDGLSEKLRDVFVLCLLEEQPATEVASLLGLPDNTVYSRLRLVREAFRNALAQSEGHLP